MTRNIHILGVLAVKHVWLKDNSNSGCHRIINIQVLNSSAQERADVNLSFYMVLQPVSNIINKGAINSTLPDYHICDFEK